MNSTRNDAPPPSATDDFSLVTELPGNGATKEQLARLYHRYHTAKEWALGKRVLEVACGTGTGLGYLATGAKSVIGGDYTFHLLKVAKAHYKDRMPLLRLDGHCLPFANRVFDLVLIFEAIYYLAEAELFIKEAKRTLAPNGILLIATVNKDWSEFSPSHFITRFFSVPDLQKLLVNEDFTNTQFYGSFPTGAVSFRGKVVSLIRKTAVSLNLMPKTLGGRSWFKKMFYGSLSPLPHEVSEGMTDLYPLDPIAGDRINKEHKIIYCIARFD